QAWNLFRTALSEIGPEKMAALAFASPAKTAKAGDGEDVSAAGTAPQHKAKIQHKKQRDSSDKGKGAGFASRSDHGEYQGQRKDDRTDPCQCPSTVVGFPGIAKLEVGANLLHAITPSL